MDANKVDAQYAGQEMQVEIRDGTVGPPAAGPLPAHPSDVTYTGGEVHVNVKMQNQELTDGAEKDAFLPPWKPYEDSGMELPVTFFVPPIYYKIRWAWVRFFMTNVVFDICIGEIIVFLLCLVVSAVPVGVAGMAKKKPEETTGGASAVPLILVFAIASRNSLFTFICGVPFERALKWHKWLALFSIGGGVYHGYVSKKWDPSGTALVAIMAALVIFSFFPIRRTIFEIFLKFHWVLFLALVVVALVHDAGIIMIGVGIWLFDVLCRCLIIWRNRKNSATALMVKLPANVIRLSFKKADFKYKSGQYVFICIPKVSHFEWHPFSISSSPNNDEVCLHIRVLGNWTKELYRVADSTETIVFIDGPYGQPSVDIDSDKYKILLFISGGIGITPMQSICNDLIHQHKRGRPLQKVVFIWSVRDAFMVTSVLEFDHEYFGTKLPGQLPFSFSPDLLSQNLGKNILDAQFYLTRAREPKDYANANINPGLQSCLKFGRPNLPDIFDNLHKLAVSSNQSRIAVLSCGPARLVSDTLKNARQFSKQGVTFDFHSELFEF